MARDSLLSCTGQSWKLLLHWAIGLAYCAVLATTEMLWFEGHVSAETRGLLLLGGSFLAIASLVFACIAIRCPVCRARWFWLAISKKEDGLRLLFSRPACPKCGSSCRILMEAHQKSC
jgi:hypothetical protein